MTDRRRRDPRVLRRDPGPRRRRARAICSPTTPSSSALAGTFIGRDAIVGFYRDLAFEVDDLWPEPGPLIVDGDRVAVEIRLRMGGTITLVGDVFTLAGGRIARVAIYSGPQLERVVTDTRTATRRTAGIPAA